MSNEVDTDRPEYSWIPFFEELARRLAEPDISDSNGAKLVELLEKMHEDGAPVPASLLNHRQSVIDPFTFFSMLNYTNITNSNFQTLAEYLKDELGIDAEVPSNEFYRPHLRPGQIHYFDSDVDSFGDIQRHWELFLYVIENRIGFDNGLDPRLIELIRQSLEVKSVRISKISMALYWVKPNEFLHVDTIVEMLRMTDSELTNPRWPGDAESYVEKLAEVKSLDSRPGPTLNNLVYLGEWDPPNDTVAPTIGERRVWIVRSSGGEHANSVVEGGYIGLGWDQAILRDCQDRDDVKRALRDADPRLDERQIGQSAGSICRYLFEMSPGDLVMTLTPDRRVQCGTILGGPTYDHDDSSPYATRRTVQWRPNGPFDRDFLPSSVWTRQQTVNELKGDQAVAALKHHDQLTGGERRVWSVKSNGGAHASSVVESGYSGVGWAFSGLPACENFDDIKHLFPNGDPEYPPARIGNEAGSLSRFLFEIKIGDYVLTSTDDGQFYYGVVTGAVTFGNTGDMPYPTRREVAWKNGDVRRRDELPTSVWQPQQAVTELKDENREAFLRLVSGPPFDRKYDIDTMLDEGVFLDESELTRIMAQLERKQNLILQGPPGTGKTFLAKRLAYALMGERADERVASVQFHQSYSYEDFVGGYRPGVNDDQQLVFESRDGAFLRLCQRAREVPDDRFVMLIDEINRGNLSRVFGELLMLIEADKRSPTHAVELQHRIADEGDPDGKFFVPPNVYIIGTMNLADRSLTGMNVAMRRRFAFAPLRPRFDSQRFATEVTNAGMPDEMLDRIKGRMTALNDVIEGDASLGRQYEVGHSFFCPDGDGPPGGDWEAWYEAVVEFEIRPLLEEYWFDDARKAADEVAKLLV